MTLHKLSKLIIQVSCSYSNACNALAGQEVCIELFLDKKKGRLVNSSNSTTQELLKGRLFRAQSYERRLPTPWFGDEFGNGGSKVFLFWDEVPCGCLGCYYIRGLLYSVVLSFFVEYTYTDDILYSRFIYIYVHEIVIEMEMSLLSNQEGLHAMVGWWNHGMGYGVGILIVW